MDYEGCVGNGCRGCWFGEVSENGEGYCRKEGKCIKEMGGGREGEIMREERLSKRDEERDKRWIEEMGMGWFIVGLGLLIKVVCVCGLLKCLVLGGVVVFVFVGVDLLLDG